VVVTIHWCFFASLWCLCSNGVDSVMVPFLFYVVDLFFVVVVLISVVLHIVHFWHNFVLLLLANMRLCFLLLYLGTLLYTLNYEKKVLPNNPKEDLKSNIPCRAQVRSLYRGCFKCLQKNVSIQKLLPLSFYFYLLFSFSYFVFLIFSFFFFFFCL